MLTFTTDKCTKEIKELKKICMKAATDESVFMDMDPLALSMLQTCFRLIDASVELMEEQADMIETMDRKLDKLLEIQGRA